MSRNRSDAGGAGTTSEGTSTGTTSSANTTGGSLGNMAPGAAGKGSGDAVVNAAPTDADPSAPQSGTPAFAAPGEGSLDNESLLPADQAQASTLYPIKLIVEGHTHRGAEYQKGQTIAVDAADFRFLVSNKLGEPGKKEDVGLPVDENGNAIKPTAPPVIELPKDQAIALAELSQQGTLQAVENAAQPKEETTS